MKLLITSKNTSESSTTERGGILSRRNAYIDSSTGQADSYIRHFLSDSENSGRKKALLNIIRYDLTPRQAEIITLFYFREMSVTEIAERLGVTPQAVSRVMATARKNIFRYLRYTFKEFL